MAFEWSVFRNITFRCANVSGGKCAISQPQRKRPAKFYSLWLGRFVFYFSAKYRRISRGTSSSLSSCILPKVVMTNSTLRQMSAPVLQRVYAIPEIVELNGSKSALERLRSLHASYLCQDHRSVLSFSARHPECCLAQPLALLQLVPESKISARRPMERDELTVGEKFSRRGPRNDQGNKETRTRGMKNRREPSKGERDV